MAVDIKDVSDRIKTISGAEAQKVMDKLAKDKQVGMIVAFLFDLAKYNKKAFAEIKKNAPVWGDGGVKEGFDVNKLTVKDLRNLEPKDAVQIMTDIVKRKQFDTLPRFLFDLEEFNKETFDAVKAKIPSLPSVKK